MPALWLKILIFAAGVVVGVLVVALANSTTPDFATSRGNSGSAAGGAQPSTAGGQAGAQARVNAACLAVINDAQDVYAALGDLGPALDHSDLMALDDIVRRLEPVEPRLGKHLRDCRIDTSIGSGGTSAPHSSGPPAATSSAPTPGSTAAPQPSPTR